MFSNLRKTIAKFIMPNTIQVPANAKSLTYNNAPRHILEQQATTVQYTGEFHVSMLDLITSNFLKNAVAQMGAWSTLARAFSEYTKMLNNKRNDGKRFTQLVEEFHCWNAACDIERQMGSDEIALNADKIAVVKAPKGSKESDAIIAKVRGCTVAELRKARQNKAERDTKAREELLTGFVTEVGHFTGNDMDPSVSHAKVAGKAIQTLEWIASQNWNPEFVAAECLLIQADLANIEKAVHLEEAKGDSGTFIDGTLTSDGLVRNAKQGRGFGEERPDSESVKNPVISAEDAEAFRQWQAAQQAA